MKIKRFNLTNSSNVQVGSASVYIHNGGSFCISEPGVKRIGVTNHDTQHYIEVIQDEDNPKDWYLALSTEGLGFKLRKEKSTNKYGFNSGIIAKEILKGLPKSPPPISTTPLTASLLIGADFIESEGLKLWPIITSSYKPKIK
jgi:hypothetical protein